MSTIIATTERLILREWEEADRTRFYERMNRPDVMRHLGGVQTFEEWVKPFERVVGFQRDFGHTFWVIEEKSGVSPGRNGGSGTWRASAGRLGRFVASVILTFPAACHPWDAAINWNRGPP